MKPKLLVVELWGIGDLTLATAFIDKVRSDYEIHLLAKSHARELLAPTYPELVFHTLSAPWTAHRGKYQLWKWPWLRLLALISDLRRQEFEVAVSVRPDPRDHVLMWLSGAAMRYGYPAKGSEILLTGPIGTPPHGQHRVECWQELAKTVPSNDTKAMEPRLSGKQYQASRIENDLLQTSKPIVCVHVGAGAVVRRWPVEHWNQLIRQLRLKFDFHLVLVPDVDNFGADLKPVSDALLGDLTLAELVYLCSRASLFLCNDSGPMHVAAACGCPTIALFGPGDPTWFRPWGTQHRMIIRDICPYRPCRDFCRFPEPYCLTKLLPGEVWPEIEQHINWLFSKKILKPALAATR